MPVKSRATRELSTCLVKSIGEWKRTGKSCFKMLGTTMTEPTIFATAKTDNRTKSLRIKQEREPASLIAKWRFTAPPARNARTLSVLRGKSIKRKSFVPNTIQVTAAQLILAVVGAAGLSALVSKSSLSFSQWRERIGTEILGLQRIFL